MRRGLELQRQQRLRLRGALAHPAEDSDRPGHVGAAALPARRDVLGGQAAQPARVQLGRGMARQQPQQMARHAGVGERGAADVVFVHGASLAGARARR